MDSKLLSSIIKAPLTLAVILLAIHPMFTAATEWECGERSNLPIEGRNYCAAGDFRLADSKLEKLLDRLITREKQVSVMAVAEQQEAHTGFKSHRSEHCLSKNTHLENKPYYEMVVAQCKTRLTNQRIKELQHKLGLL